MDSLGFVGGIINIVYNVSLVNFEGLRAIQGLGLEQFIIDNNPNLENLTHLNNFDFRYITELKIVNNSKLDDCAIVPICDYLSNCGHAVVHSNKGDRWTLNHLKSSCNPDTENPCNNVTISPNPANDYINILFQNLEIENINYEIFDQQGRRIIRFSEYKSSPNYTLDISALAAGIYYLRLTSVKDSKLHRFLKH